MQESGLSHAPARFDWARLPGALERHLDRLRAGGPRGWRPSRLILQNYWHFGYEVFHFVHGRLVLRGANGTGKSTVLASAITLVLDGEKRRERMDTFGGQGRSVAYYLVGDPASGPDSDYYFEDRTGYVALEFEHGTTGRYLTIGVGLYTSRARPALDVDFWGFAIQDGRRVGIDLDLHDGGSPPVPLTARQLRERLGSGGTVMERAREYQSLVNRLLFGFETEEDYEFLLGVLLKLRSPKLNKDIKPSDVCRLLTESLPPLDDDLLLQATHIIEDIDQALESLAETRRHLDAVVALDDRLAHYLNQLAQERAVRLRDAHGRLAEARARLREEELRLLAARDQRDATRQRIETVARLQREVQGRIQVLEAHAAFQEAQQLGLAEQDLAEQREAEHRAEEALASARHALAGQEEQVRRLGEQWGRDVETAAGQAAELLRVAAEAAWAEAAAALEGLPAALAAARPEGEEDLEGRYPQAYLAARGEERLQLLEEALARAVAEEEARQAHERARERVGEAQDAVLEADRALRRAEEELEAAREGVAADLHAWRRTLQELDPPDRVLAAVSVAAREYPQSGEDVGALLQPLAEVAREARRMLEDERGARERELAALGHQAELLRSELDGWLQRKEAEPPRRPGQAEARRLLAERGIPCVPLYAACDFRPGTDLALAARVEAALDESGLLDALIVPTDRAAEAAALLEAHGLGDRWLNPLGPAPAGAAGGPVDAAGSPASGTGSPDGDSGSPAVGLLALLQPVPGPVPETDVARALASVGWEASGLAGEVSGVVGIGVTGRWYLGPLHGTATAPTEPAVAYIGEANRRRRREETVARLRAALADLEARIAALQAEVDVLRVRTERLDDELKQAWGLPCWDRLRRAAVEVERAREWLDSRQRIKEQAERERERAYQALAAARVALEAALGPVPEARGRTPDGLRALLAATRQFLTAAADLGAAIGRIPGLREVYRQAVQARAREEERVRAAHENRMRARERTANLAARCAAIRERIARMGVTVEELTRELGDLRAEDDRLRQEAEHLQHELGVQEERVRVLEREVGQQRQAVEGLESEESAARTALRERLRAYPTLRRHLELFDSGPEGPLAAAEDLVRQRRAAPEDLPRVVEEGVRSAWRDLTALFHEHRSLLVEYRPELEEEAVTFRQIGVRVLPYQLRRELERHLVLQEQVLREKESELYEDFLLKEVASSIRERIAAAEGWRDRINALLAGRRLSNGEVLSIAWRPRPPDRITGVNTARVVELLRRDAETLTDPEIQELVQHFRARVGEVREREKRNELEKPFGDALREVLDYREWFEFALYSRLPGEERQELTDHRFMARSGAEKSLAMFIPLLAAAHARFESAAPDAPRLVGLDEAFAGVDEQNTREMFRFLVELDFSWIMTSEKLWGVADTLPGCATYELVRRGSVVMPILYVWDGQARHGSLEYAAGRVAAP